MASHGAGSSISTALSDKRFCAHPIATPFRPASCKGLIPQATDRRTVATGLLTIPLLLVAIGPAQAAPKDANARDQDSRKSTEEAKERLALDGKAGLSNKTVSKALTGYSPRVAAAK